MSKIFGVHAKLASTNWSSYPVSLVGFGTATNVSAYSRRVGDSLEVIIQFTAGTTTATIAQLSIGFNGVNANVTIDTSKIPSISVQGLIGSATSSTNSTTFFGIAPFAPTTNQTFFNVGTQTSAAGSFQAVNANTFANTGNILNFHIMVPIVGWSSADIVPITP